MQFPQHRNRISRVFVNVIPEEHSPEAQLRGMN